MRNGFIAMIAPKLNQNLSFDFFSLILTSSFITLLGVEFQYFFIYSFWHIRSPGHIYFPLFSSQTHVIPACSRTRGHKQTTPHDLTSSYAATPLYPTNVFIVSHVMGKNLL